MQLTLDECLAAAWTYCAPNRSKGAKFPRGFWPDVARVALEMFEQQTTEVSLDWCPTRCVKGNYPEHRTVVKRKAFLGLNLDKLEINL